MNGTLPGPTAPASTSSEANLALTGSSTRSGPTVHGARAPREDWHAPPQASRLAAMLDETDHPMLLLHATKLTVLHANRAAVQELGDPSQSTDTGRSALDRQAQEHPLHVREGQLKARDSRDDEQLLATIDDARRRGLRRLLTLGKREAALSIAVTPMPRGDDDTDAVLLVFGKRSVCADLSAYWFGRAHGLTQAECGVLQRLCEGLGPTQIARRHAVAVSTVRSQLASVRAKTAARDLRELVNRVAKLPPLVRALGSGTAR
jgi:DNA-binding CsgD family transcriptional regulator